MQSMKGVDPLATESFCHGNNLMVAVLPDLALYPGSWWVGGKKEGLYLLFVHTLNFPEILGNQELSCYIRTTVTS